MTSSIETVGAGTGCDGDGFVITIGMDDEVWRVDVDAEATTRDEPTGDSCTAGTLSGSMVGRSGACCAARPDSNLSVPALQLAQMASKGARSLAESEARAETESDWNCRVLFWGFDSFRIVSQWLASLD